MLRWSTGCIDWRPCPEGRERQRARVAARRGAAGELEWSDFDHIAEARDHVEALLRGALGSGKRGVNILVHGEPGTGKTEFCRTLARKARRDALYRRRIRRRVVTSPRVGSGSQELRLAQRLLAQSTRCGPSVRRDGGPAQRTKSPFRWMDFVRPTSFVPIRAPKARKCILNRLLEQTPVPTLWTSNSAGETCEAVLRRMMFAVELRQPPSNVRARIWSRQLARHDIESDDNDARTLAFEYDVTPGVASGVTAAAELVDGGGLDAVRCGVRSLARVLSRETASAACTRAFRARARPCRHQSRFAREPACRWRARTRCRSAFRDRPGRGRARSCATSRSAWGLRSCRSAPPI